MTRRGDVVVVAFPYVSGGGGKNRPALVIQSDRDNQKLANTVVAMITGNMRYAGKESTHILVDPATPEGQSSGLNHASVVKCNNVFTVAQDDILATIGHVAPSLMSNVDAGLKAALELP